ncbi:MAG: CVNH domain-containing protein [Betaproteobacteria bacterium]|nr:CVNH domain-containing protein [Betaproteobacteria bacterium]
MPSYPRVHRSALAALACCSFTAPAAPPQPPQTVPTDFVVRNRLPVALHDFRVLGAGRDWIELGDLPPGDSYFRAEVPSGAWPGSFEFRQADQLASGAYTLGGYRRPAEGPVRIEVDAAVAETQGWPLDGGRGSVWLAAGGAEPWAPGPLDAGQRVPLTEVPAARAGYSRWMACTAVAVLPGFMECITSGGLFYGGMGFGLFAGAAYGYFWSDYPLDTLAGEFPLHASFTHVVLAQYASFFTMADEHHPSLTLGQFVGLGPGLGTAYTALGSLSVSPPDAPPAGSYTLSCSNIAFDGARGVVAADCANATGAMHHSELAVASCLGSDLRNDDGTLDCDHPPGSYLRSCQPLRYAGGLLQGACERPGGAGAVAARLDYASDCEPGSEVSNANGQLRCDSPRLPAGPYRGSCIGLRFADGVLEADCGSGIDARSRRLRLEYARACEPGSDVGFEPGYAGRGRLYCVRPRAASG